MSPTFVRAKELFVAALEIPEPEREAWLETACAGDARLRAEVCSLLAFRARGDAIERRFEASVDVGVPRGASAVRVEGFRVLELLGAGGMGVVYLAEQEHPRRKVALKILRHDAAGENERRRFRREVELVARVEHPGVAKVFAAGIATDELGERPWFAMEYIVGDDLIAHAERSGLDLAQRVELFARVSAAVAAAHRCGIVHRDLKPSNVLVESRGRAVVLDFGVACALDEQEPFDSLRTRTGQVLGTLAYMSPEQAAGERVDARSDVYSLGAMLYELVTGRPTHVLEGLLLHDAVRRITEIDPPRAGRLRPEVSGDLDAVLATALAKEPLRRYADAAEFADDLARLLAHRPVLARRPTATYQAVKFVRRHRTGVLATAFVGCALTLALALVLFEIGRAREATLGESARSAEVQRVLDARKLDELKRRAESLWPSVPERAADFEAWLVEARELASRLEAHRAVIAELRAELARPDLDLIARVRSEALTSVEATLVEGLDEFVGDSRSGTLRDVERRLAFARTIRAKSIEAHASEWSAAIERIASSKLYHGLQLAPQLGLVPLGPDPHSGLEEFAFAEQSGRRLTRDAQSGELVLYDDQGLVFVLLPAGAVRMGWQNVDPWGEHYSVMGRMSDAPCNTVELDAFFLSKFEMTKGQWIALTGVDPSYQQIDGAYYDGPITARHPVESVSWEDCTRLFGHLGLVLPTEARWEYAARAGTQTEWWAGSDWRELECMGDLDENHETLRRDFGLDVELRDTYGGEAPVGSFRANPFGLYDLNGNVAEWCADAFDPLQYNYPVRAGDGLRLVPPTRLRTRRGGDSGERMDSTTSCFRCDSLLDLRSALIGVRPARDLDGLGVDAARARAGGASDE